MGEKSANGSWNGNLGLLERKQAVLYLKTESPIVQASANWLKMSMPLFTEAFIILQEISPQDKHEEFNLMQKKKMQTKKKTNSSFKKKKAKNLRQKSQIKNSNRVFKTRVFVRPD